MVYESLGPCHKTQLTLDPPAALEVKAEQDRYSLRRHTSDNEYISQNK
jgi:hypothetical protein